MTQVAKERAVFLISGLIFGLGLVISGMVLPDKVQNFLDVTGNWDPSLAFVMMGAIAVHTPFVRWAQRRGRSFFGDALQLPKRKDIDWRLVTGAAIFGVGWGIAGICPGPGIVDVVTLAPGVIAFVGAMVLGMLAEHAFERKISSGQQK